MPRCAKKFWPPHLVLWCSDCGSYMTVRKQASSSGTQGGRMYNLMGIICGHRLATCATRELIEDLATKGLSRLDRLRTFPVGT